MIPFSSERKPFDDVIYINLIPKPVRLLPTSTPVIVCFASANATAMSVAVATTCAERSVLSYIHSAAGATSAIAS